MTLNVGFVVTSWLMANITQLLMLNNATSNISSEFSPNYDESVLFPLIKPAHNIPSSSGGADRRYHRIPGGGGGGGSTTFTSNLRPTDRNYNPLRIAIQNIDRRVSPSGIGLKPYVDIRTDLVAVEQINDKAKLVTVVWYVEMMWLDPRLVWNATLSNIRTLDVVPSDIWTPDFRFLEWEMVDRRQMSPQKQHIFDTDAVREDDGVNNGFVDLMRYATLVVNHDGRVHLSGFIVDEALCSNMNARLYPFDVQTCNFTFKVGNARFLPTMPSKTSTTQTGAGGGTAPGSSKWQETRPLEPLSSGDWRDKRVLVSTTGGIRRHILTIERIPNKHIIISIMPPDILTAVAILGSFYGCQSGERFAFTSMIVTSVLLLLDNVDQEIPIRSSSFPVIAYYYIGLLLVTLLAMWLSKLSASLAARAVANATAEEIGGGDCIDNEQADVVNEWPLLAGQYALYDERAQLRHTSLGDCLCVGSRIVALRQLKAARRAAAQERRKHKKDCSWYFYALSSYKNQQFVFFCICVNAFVIVNLWAFHEWDLI